VSRAHLHPALAAALLHYPTDARIVLHWDDEDGGRRGITDTIGSVSMLVHAATVTCTGGNPMVEGLPGPPLPVFGSPALAHDYLRRRALDPGPVGHACRQALLHLTERRHASAEYRRIAETPVGETVALF
jgi:hypothetical protein